MALCWSMGVTEAAFVALLSWLGCTLSLGWISLCSGLVEMGMLLVVDVDDVGDVEKEWLESGCW